MLGSREILYESEVAINNLSYERIYLKKAVGYNPRLINRICYLRGHPSYLLKLIKGAVVDMDGSDPVSILESESQDINRGIEAVGRQIWAPPVLATGSL